jgi:3-deoxy-D-manno-octulosonic-acid transferase
MARFLYTLVWCLVTPLVVLYLLWRARRQRGYLAGWGERWGLHPRRADDAPLVWVHAVSVGETRAAQPLVEALLARDPRCRVLLTHMTPTGRETGEELFARRHPGRVVQAFLPYDYPYAVRRFLAAWRPALGIVMETELWPNLCAAAARAGVPLALVNARLSEKSLRKGLRWRSLFEPAARSLARVIAQTEGDAQRIRALAGVDAIVAGNVKFDVTPPAAMLERGARWREAAGGRAVLLAASTRDGEEALLLEAWARRSAGNAATGALDGSDAVDAVGVSDVSGAPDVSDSSGARPLLAIVPRHPQRFDEVAAAIAQRGLRLVRRSALGESLVPDPLVGADVLLGDSMGEMFAYYAMADVAVLGGSLLPFGGQNLIEACAAGVPVVVGEHTFNFAEAAEQAVAAGAAFRVADADAAIGQCLALLGDEAARRRAGECGARFAAQHRGATGRTLAAIAGLLPAVAG